MNRTLRRTSLLSLTLASVFAWSSVVLGAEYAWSSQFERSTKFKNAMEACIYTVNKYGVYSYSRRFTSLSPRQGTTEFYCNMEVTFSKNGTWQAPSPPYWSSMNGYISVFRTGDACPVGETYDAAGGECFLSLGGSEQIGRPSNPPTCTSLPPSSFAGNPINFANGNKYQNEQLLHLLQHKYLKFEIFYNSVDGLWRHNFSTRVRDVGDRYVLVMADGRESHFTISGASILPAPYEAGMLEETTSGWRYDSSSNERYFFNSQGRLIQITAADSSEIKLAYSNQEVIVSGEFGTLTFSESSQQLPFSAALKGIQATFYYNAAKQLQKAIMTNGANSFERIFHYEDSRNPKLLTGITDERGVRYATWSYDDQGRGISSEHAGGTDKVTIAYSTDSSSTVTNELGKKTTYRFAEFDGIRRITAIEGEPSPNCPYSNSTFTYDERGLLKTKTDNKGHLTTFDYNERGLEVSRTEAVGTPQARIITTAWHPDYFLPVTVTEPDRITQYTYDAQGRQLSQSVTQR